MRRFVEGTDRGQSTLFPEYLEDWIDENNSVRVIDVFVDELDLAQLGFYRVAPEVTGRPAYHPSVLLKLYIYGYLNRVQSSRRLERETGRNVEVMWLTGRLVPDHKTIADFRKDNGEAIGRVCARFIVLCRALDLVGEVSIAIDGSKFKAVNNRDKNFTRAKMERRLAQIEESVARYLRQLDSADRQEASQARDREGTGSDREERAEDARATIFGVPHVLTGVPSKIERVVNEQVTNSRAGQADDRERERAKGHAQGRDARRVRDGGDHENAEVNANAEKHLEGIDPPPGDAEISRITRAVVGARRWRRQVHVSAKD